MSTRLVAVVFVILLAIITAFVTPTIINGMDDETSATITLDQGESEQIMTTLETQVTDVGDGEATITITNPQTGSEDTQTISEGNESQYTIDGDAATVTVTNVSDPAVTVTVEYPRTFGMHESTEWLPDNIGLLLVATVTVLFGVGMGRVL